MIRLIGDSIRAGVGLPFFIHSRSPYFKNWPGHRNLFFAQAQETTGINNDILCLRSVLVNNDSIHTINLLVVAVPDFKIKQTRHLIEGDRTGRGRHFLLAWGGGLSALFFSIIQNLT
jgi:hypothetical protein